MQAKPYFRVPYRHPLIHFFSKIFFYIKFMNTVYNTSALDYLQSMEQDIDLIYTSPPYNVAKSYEKRLSLDEYMASMMPIFELCVKRLKPTGSICIQLGNTNVNGMSVPLDYIYFPYMSNLGLTFVQRVIWQYRHGFSAPDKFTPSHESIMWFSKGDYYFDLDSIRVPQIDPYKRKNGRLTGNPLGKNPSNVWVREDVYKLTEDLIVNIPQVNSSSCESVKENGKKVHPCQTPVGLASRFVLGLCPEGGLVFDPFAGVGSVGVAAVCNKRQFIGCEINKDYADAANRRLQMGLNGELNNRPHDAKILEYPRKP